MGSIGEYILHSKNVSFNTRCHLTRSLHTNKKSKDKRFGDGWTIDTCLLEWAKLFGRERLTRDILDFEDNCFGIRFTWHRFV